MTRAPAIAFNEWTVHLESGELEKGGKRARLPDQALLILEALLDRPGELVTREHLIARLWPQGVVDFEASLNAAVRKLRLALGDDADTPRYIETVPRKGYRFIAKLVEQTSKTPSCVSGESFDLPRGQATTVRPLQKWPWSLICIWGALGVVAFVVIGLYLTRSPQPPDTEPQPIRLAVMPFENLSPDAADAFFTDGMHEEILGTLANRATNLSVISRTTMMTYRAAPKSVTDVAKELGVTHVLEGSVRREGKTVRVSLKLIDAHNDRPVWTKHYDRQLVNAIELQSEVAAEVTSRLSVELLANAKSIPITTSPEAYDLYLKGKLAARNVPLTATVEEVARIETLFNSAIELDPLFAVAYEERALLRLGMRAVSHDLSDAHLDRVRSDIAKARDLGGTTGSLLVVEARFAGLADGDRAKALELVESAESLGALSAEGLNFKALLMREAGRPEEAITLYSRAGGLDPANSVTFWALSGIYSALRRPAEAFQVLRAFNERNRTKLPKGEVIFAFTGQTDELARDVDALPPAIEDGQRLERRFQLARVQDRRTELIAIIDRSGVKELRQFGWNGYVLQQVGRKPVAELYGWAKLLNGDRAGAVSDGRTLLKFVERQSVTSSNDWYLRLLAAEGQLFSGENARAVAETRTALARTGTDRGLNVTRHVRETAAMILAWAGEENEAVALLEQISTEYPGVGPAVIIRDPLYSTPLARNARYKSLEMKLEAEIAANLKLPR